MSTGALSRLSRNYTRYVTYNRPLKLAKIYGFKSKLLLLLRSDANTGGFQYSVIFLNSKEPRTPKIEYPYKHKPISKGHYIKMDPILFLFFCFFFLNYRFKMFAILTCRLTPLLYALKDRLICLLHRAAILYFFVIRTQRHPTIQAKQLTTYYLPVFNVKKLIYIKYSIWNALILISSEPYQNQILSPYQAKKNLHINNEFGDKIKTAKKKHI